MSEERNDPEEAEKLRFILDQGQIHLDDTIESYDQLTGKGYTLFGICIPLTAAVGFAATQYTEDGLWSQPISVYLALSYAALLVVCSALLCVVIFPANVKFGGVYPEPLLKEKTFPAPLTWLLRKQAEHMQRYIDSNLRLNYWKGLAMKAAMILFVISPLIACGVAAYLRWR